MVTLKQLITLNKRKEQVRAKAKEEMRIAAKEILSEAKIVFPRIHLGEHDTQLRYGLPWIYNGFLVYLPGLVMAVDPGPDFMFRIGLSDITISHINTLFVSHGHLDHVAGANILSDWLIRSQQDTEIIAPQDVFTQNEISPYHSGFKAHSSGWKNNHFATPLTSETEEILLSHGKYLMTPIQLFHGTPCYGFTLEYKTKKITYISDTGYAQKILTTEGTVNLENSVPQGEFISIDQKRESLRAAVFDTDILIVNVETLEYEKSSWTHLTLYDVIDLVKGSSIKHIIIAHCNPLGELPYKSWGKLLADFLSQETGIPAVAPNINGLTLAIES